MEAETLYRDLLRWLWANDEDFRSNWTENYDESLEDSLTGKYALDPGGPTGWDELHEILDGWREKRTITLPDGTLVDVEDFRNGGDEEGTVRWLVLRVTPKDGSAPLFFKKDGYWVSFDGGYWEGSFSRVRPVERLVMEYVS